MQHLCLFSTPAASSIDGYILGMTKLDYSYKRKHTSVRDQCSCNYSSRSSLQCTHIFHSSLPKLLLSSHAVGRVLMSKTRLDESNPTQGNNSPPTTTSNLIADLMQINSNSQSHKQGISWFLTYFLQLCLELSLYKLNFVCHAILLPMPLSINASSYFRYNKRLRRGGHRPVAHSIIICGTSTFVSIAI